MLTRRYLIKAQSCQSIKAISKVSKKRPTGNHRSTKKGRGNIRNLNTRVKTAKGRKISSTRWLNRQLNDPYVEAAKRDGYRSRAAYKLLQLDELFRILKPGMKVVDLGAAPGGWSQVVSRGIRSDQIGSSAKLIAVDIIEMDPLPGTKFVLQDFMSNGATLTIKEALEGRADAILSDISPPLTGHRQTDHLRIIAAAEAAYEFSRELLHNGGCFVAKVFQGGTENALLNELKKNFESIKHAKPAASRTESSEVYVVAQGYYGVAGYH